MGLPAIFGNIRKMFIHLSKITFGRNSKGGRRNVNLETINITIILLDCDKKYLENQPW
jgi:hypothetical protein